jgi:hypothetical protein
LPPSTGILTPLTEAAAGEHKNAITAAVSCGVVNLPIGISFIKSCSTSSIGLLVLLQYYPYIDLF